MTSTRGGGGRRSTYTTSTAAGGGGGAQESSMPSVSPGRPIRGLARTKVRHMDRPPFGVNNARRLSPALSRSLPNSNDGGARSARTGFFPDRYEKRSPRLGLPGERWRGGHRRRRMRRRPSAAGVGVPVRCRDPLDENPSGRGSG